MADSLPPLGPNPYVGPTPFTVADQNRFYGRSEEIGQLTSLVIAHRTVLFYAQSGAGKTSLINAGLVPRLTARNRLRVLPVASVGGAQPDNSGPRPANIFVYNLLSSLYTGVEQPTALIEQDLQTGIPTFLGEDTINRQPSLLIVDQFEEFFTHYAERSEERSDFFLQLQQTLAAYPRLGLLLSMREDYVTHLDFYTGQMPDRLRTRLRMERLTYQGALEAITRPAEGAGRSFDKGVAEELTNNLRRIQRRRSTPADAVENDAALGDYVEPVHLQLVCKDLWDRLPPDQRQIHSEDLRTFGNVDEALAAFYEKAVAQAVNQTDVNPRLLRGWFAQQLITPARTRSLLYQGDKETAGLANNVVQVLRDAYILRGVVRGDDLFFELTHDRLIEPILNANAAWLSHYYNPLAEAAKAWIASGRSRANLLKGANLTTANRFAAEHPQDLLTEEQEFLETSLQEDRRRRLMQGGILISAMLVLVLLAFVVYGEIENRERRAEAARESARAEAQQKLAEARRLAGLSMSAIDDGFSEDGRRLALEAGTASQENPPSEAFSAIRHALAAPVRVGHVMTVEPDIPFQALQFSPDHSQVAALNTNGVLAVWDVETGQRRFSIQAHEGGATRSNLAWRPDGAAIVTGGMQDQTVRIWSDAGDLRKELSPFPTGVRSVGWNRQGDRLATVDNTIVRIWDAWGDTLIVDSDIHTATIQVAEWSPDGRYFLSGDRAGQIYLWPVEDASQSPILLGGHTNIIRDVDWSLDSTRLLSGSSDGTARLWDLQRFTQITPTLQSGVGSIAIADFSPNDEWILLYGAQSGGEIWNTATLTRSAILLIAGEDGSISTFEWREDGQKLLTGGRNGQVRVWDVATGAADAIPIQHRGSVDSVRWGADERTILSGGRETDDNSTLRRWDLATGQSTVIGNYKNAVFWVEEIGDEGEIFAASHDGTLRTYRTQIEAELPIIQPSDQWVIQARWNGDEDQILVASGNAATLWDAQTGRLLFPMPHDAQVRNVRWIQDETQILSTGQDGFLRIWDAKTGALLDSIEQSESADYAREDLAGTVIVSGLENGEVYIRDMATRTLICSLKVADDREDTRDIAASVRFQRADSGRVVTASRNGQVQMWDFRACEKLYDLPTTFTEAREAFWNPNGRTLAIAYGIGGPPLIWDAEKAETVWILADPEEPITNTIQAILNGPESYLMTRDADQRVRIWDMQTGSVAQRLEHPAPVSSAMWSSDSQIITADDAGSVRIWQVGQDQPVGAFGAEFASSRIVGLSYRGESNMLLTWSPDGTARLWNTETGAEYARLEGHTQPIVSGVWNRDGSQVMTWSEDGSVRRYYVYMDDLLGSACRLTTASVRPPLCDAYLAR
ncbi:MAG: hypothetical protein KF893_21580 [Caldilineaceae bacterium]|nr:hypothetical protein [Caldilineaceae bacterium]